LYIKHTEDGKMWVAWCHHCGRKRAKPITGITVPSPMSQPSVVRPSSAEVQRSIDRAAVTTTDPFVPPFKDYFAERRVNDSMLAVWVRENIFPRYLRCSAGDMLGLAMRKNILCADDEMLRGMDVGTQLRHVEPHGGPKYITLWNLPENIRQNVQMTPCIIPPICMPLKVDHHRLVFTEDLITALRFAYVGVQAISCSGAGNLTDDLLWRTAQDYPAITEVAFAFDNDGTAISRIQEKALVTAELLYTNVVYDPRWRYDRTIAATALRKWGW